MQNDFELNEIKHIPLEDNQSENETSATDQIEHHITKNETDSSVKSIELPSDTPQTWSSILCYAVTFSLLKLTNAIVASSLTLLIPLFAAKAYPNNGEAVAGYIITCQGIGLVASAPFCGTFISYTTNEFAIIFAAVIRTIALILIVINPDKIYLWIIVAIVYGTSMTIQNIAVKCLTAKFIKTKKRGRFSSVEYIFIYYISSLLARKSMVYSLMHQICGNK